MNTVPVATLILRVQQDANLEGATAFITPAEIVDRLNRARRELVDELRASGGAGYFRHRTTIPTVAGTSLYSLPVDFISISFVLAYLTPTQFIRCAPFTDDMRPMFATILGTGWVFGQPVYYQLDDSGAGQTQIEFMPVPTGQFSAVVGYQYAPADFVQGGAGDPFDDINGWSEYMVARAASGCARKAKFFDLSAALMGEAGTALERIKRMAPLRDIGTAEVVRDVTRTAPAGYWEEYDS